MPIELAPGLLSWASILEDQAREQAITTAALPFIKPHLALMPDAHWGLGSTVGSVIPTEDVVIPASVGVDLGCVDAETEYLSPTGWRRIADYAGGPVMQYEPDTGTGRFAEPEKFIMKDCPELLRVRTKYGVDQLLSPDHRVLAWRIVGRDRRREMAVMTASELEARHNALVLGARVEFETTFTPVLDTKLAMSDDQIRAQVMFHADGSLDGHAGVLRLNKDRKIKRARSLLTAAGIGWTEGVGADGVTAFRFHPPRETKSYGELWWSASAAQLGVIADEVLNWDGNQDDQAYFTRDRASADFIHYVFTATGKRGVLRADTHYRDGETDYRVFAQSNTRVGINGSPKTPITRELSVDGKAYCFTLPSGFWVMRRGGNIAMTGNCGMSGLRTHLTAADLDGHNLGTLRSAIEREIPVSMGKYRDTVSDTAAHRVVELEDRATRDGVDANGYAANWRQQLGTLGSGNHFVELTLDEDDRVWVFLHSGSRGIGNRIARKHIKRAQDLCAKWYVQLPHKDLAFLPHGTDEFWEYIRDLRWAQAFAAANRAEMVDAVVRCLAEWLDTDVRTEELITCHHNYTEQEVHFGKKRWITRKGAINAEKGRRGLIPGSMGTRSYVVTGLGNPASFNSAPHGAGRNFSRKEARRRFTAADLTEAMKGIEWRSDIAEDLVDEIPGAYKDVDVVMHDAADLVRIDHTLRQILNVKGS